MSVWSAQSSGPTLRLAGFGPRSGLERSRDRAFRRILWLGCLICVLVAEGFAVSHSYLWAAPLVGILFVAVATDLPVVPFLAITLFVRVLTDDRGNANSHHTGSLNFSGLIAVLIILVAIGPLIRRQRGARTTLLALLWLCLWTAIAVRTDGASAETIREGVREASVVALAVMVYNARGAITVPTATRVVQIIGVIPAFLALYQFATHTGLDVAGEIRANGTFVHPNSAAIFFAMATVVSLWRYLDNGRRRSDALLVALFAAAVIATFSIDGLLSMLVMLIAFGTLRPGSVRAKLGAFAVAALVILTFLATPLGAERIAKESASNVTSAERGEANSSFSWRLYKWETLLPEWERSPVFGRGLGTTLTSEATDANTLAGFEPHNEYLRYLVETGIVGLATLLCAVGILIRALVRKRRIPGTLTAGTLNAATLALAIVIGCLFDAIADNSLTCSTTDYTVVLVVGAVFSIPDIRRSAAAARRRCAVPAPA
jgi:O-antigen ligase